MTRPAALGLLLVALAGCGSGKGSDGALAWQTNPRLFTTPRNDHVLIGEVTNSSNDRVMVEANALKLLDLQGRTLRAAVAFRSGFVKSNFPHNKGPLAIPENERLRLGQLAELDPGKSTPLTISWHEPPGPSAAARIDTGYGFLPVPPK